MPVKEYDLFLSYKREDAAIVKLARSALETGGVRCWMDPDILPANQWDVAIPDAIARSRFLAVFVSAHAEAHPRQIKREIAVAEKYQTPLLFLRLDKSELHNFTFLMATEQWLDVQLPLTAEQGGADGSSGAGITQKIAASQGLVD